MTRTSHTSISAWLRLIVACLVLLLLAPSSAFAADNTATGDVAGTPGDLTDSNTFSLSTTVLALTKTAFLSDGTPLTTGDSLPAGTGVKFMVYIDNPTGTPVLDVNVQDILVATFGYQAGTIKVDNSVADGSTEAAIYAAVNATAALDDAVDGTDVAGIAGATISAGSSAGNLQVDVAANSVWALLFEVQMQ